MIPLEGRPGRYLITKTKPGARIVVRAIGTGWHRRFVMPDYGRWSRDGDSLRAWCYREQDVDAEALLKR